MKGNRSNYRHGHARKGAVSVEYTAWNSMMARCFNSSVKHFGRYGGRGITVCERWLKFENFLADMGARPSRLHSLDRYPDKDGHYEPSNCRWATRKEQSRNTATNNIIEFDGRRMALAEAIESSGLRTSTVSMRLVRGWPVHAALTLPLGAKYERK